jgi:hypothetical protein
VTKDNRKIVKTIQSGFTDIVGEVHVYNTTLGHIKKFHPTEYQSFSQVESTIEGDATRITKSKTNDKAVLFINDSFTSSGGDPLRIPVKVYDDGHGILSTAYFSSAKDHGEILWEHDDDA